MDGPAEHQEREGRRGVAIAEDFSALLEAARAGSEHALTAIYRQNHPPLLRYLRALQPLEAEDLASEAWVDVARGLARFQGGEEDFRRWLFTIARRRLIDLQRSRRRRPVEPRPLQALPDVRSGGDVEAEAMEHLSTRAAVALIATLPRDQSEVVLLRVVAGLSAKDVAAVLGKRPGTVRVLQHRALERLARSLSRTTPVTK